MKVKSPVRREDVEWLIGLGVMRERDRVRNLVRLSCDPLLHGKKGDICRLLPFLEVKKDA